MRVLQRTTKRKARKFALLTAAALAALTLAVAATPKQAGPAYIYPDVSGATNASVTQANIDDTICSSGWTKTIRPSTAYTNAVKKEKLKAYNEEHGTNWTMQDGELDHLISLQLGGDPISEKNLWFEPYYSHIGSERVGAREKDAVETYLKTRVCDHAISLIDAQLLIAKDWYDVYTHLTYKVINENDTIE